LAGCRVSAALFPSLSSLSVSAGLAHSRSRAPPSSGSQVTVLTLVLSPAGAAPCVVNVARALYVVNVARALYVVSVARALYVVSVARAVCYSVSFARAVCYPIQVVRRFLATLTEHERFSNLPYFQRAGQCLRPNQR
jgi:hypothetical protein